MIDDFSLAALELFYRTCVPLQKICEKLKNNGHLAFGHQSLEVPLHVTKTLQTQTKRNHNVWKNTRDRTAELLMPFSSRTHVEPQTEDESTKRGSHYDRCSIPWLADSLLLLLWSHGAFDLLVFWLQRKRRVEKVKSQCGRHACVDSFE